MAAGRVRTSVQFRRRGPGRSSWARSIFSELFVGAGTKVLLGLFALDNPGISETIRRTRGRILVSSDQSAAVEVQKVAFGMIVINDLALAAGAASIPGPLTDGDDGSWFVWEPLLTIGARTPGGVVLNSQDGSQEFDSKAMRRIETGFGLALMIEAQGVGAEVAVALSMLTTRV